MFKCIYENRRNDSTAIKYIYKTPKPPKKRDIKEKIKVKENDLLKQCPFCGSDLVDILGASMFWCECFNCGACTKVYSTKEDASKAWNTRAGKK